MDITIPQNIISGILSSSKKDSIYQKGKIQLIQIYMLLLKKNTKMETI